MQRVERRKDAPLAVAFELEGAARRRDEEDIGLEAGVLEVELVVADRQEGQGQESLDVVMAVDLMTGVGLKLTQFGLPLDKLAVFDLEAAGDRSVGAGRAADSQRARLATPDNR